jgi:NADP-dependent 3-hydroxy acid dehydrogenase YdfG
MVHTEILTAGGYEIPDGKSLDEFYDSVPHLKSQDISDAIIYALGTPPHVQV